MNRKSVNKRAMFYKMEEMVRNRALKINNKANSSLNSRNRDPLFNIFAEFVSNSNFNRPACCQTEKGNLRERVSERQTKEKVRLITGIVLAFGPDIL